MSIKNDDQLLIKEILKEHVDTYKQKNNYSQEEIVQHSGVSKEVISRISNSKSLINIHTLAQLINALGMDPNALFAEYKERSKFFNQEE